MRLLLEFEMLVIPFLLGSIHHGNAMDSCILSVHESVRSLDVQFRLCTTKFAKCEVHLKNPINSNILNVHGFDPNHETFVLIHGFLRNHQATWIQEMTSIVLSQGPANIIVVDWSSAYGFYFLSQQVPSFDILNYKKAVLSTPQVADQINGLLRYISRAFAKPLNQWRKLHFVGHSLGAHIAGQAARRLKDVVQVHRITGLDPAGPCFDGVKTIFKLDRSDAKFVDVIHTNCDPKENNNLGIAERLGTIDFYVNGGNNQPRCTSKLEKGVGSALQITGVNWILSKSVSVWHKIFYGSSTDLEGLISNLVRRGYSLICDHEEANTYFVESLRQSREKYYGIRLRDVISNDTSSMAHGLRTGTCVEMGMSANQNEDARGVYLVSTVYEYSVCDNK